ncbi:PEPxxWA-CTERM sorting domain-containing protein [Methylobacillus arboreus]|uniref:PEPxxWA-CTERM sorting domain-containing protein n=1 Tax=Methylobacillus arboreus TaxID=755170 RepID=UPI001E2CD238|nr:PEPxxWA-CTERM sorting domain-containing protein [Methylobacillus arboreus]MCB5190619.1 PEPxxWA-CTERM sorting domain-containing protein [Methylobacillus arboreus]
MNIKMKALVAVAVAAMSISGVASAALDSGAAGNSSLVLTLLDRNSSASATFDLGFTYSSFSAGGSDSSVSFNWNLGSGDYAAAWNEFFSLADANSVVWNISAGDNLGLNTEVGTKGFITTTREGAAVPEIVRTVQISGAATAFDKYVEANKALGNHADVENGASVATNGSAYASVFLNGNKFSNIGPLATSALDTEQGVVQYVTGLGSTGYVTPSIYDATFRLGADGLLTYTVAAVPEPETYALLLAGLGLVGAAARRRKSA